MFIKDSLKEKISQLKKFKLNIAKGAVAIRFQYELKTFMMINVHLSAGKNSIKSRT